jgi:hypothetical protein
VILEIDTVLGRVRRESRSVQDLELEVRGESALSRPREVPVADASVNEDETLHGGNVTCNTNALAPDVVSTPGSPHSQAANRPPALWRNPECDH